MKMNKNLYNIIKEVGEATIQPYEWWNANETYLERKECARGQYTFETDDGLEYNVIFSKPELKKPEWNISFKAVDDEDQTDYTDKSPNRGEPLKIMSTISQIVKDFIMKKNPQILTIEAAKEGDDDNRRLKMYQAFVEKQVPQGYSMKREGDRIILKKNKLSEIIQEEINHLLKEYSKDGDVDWDLWEKRHEIKHSIFMDFLFNNNPDFTKHIPWRLVQYPMLKKVWEDYMRFGFLRNTKPLDTIESIMIANTLKIDVLTVLAGHTSVDPEEDFQEWFEPLMDEYVRWKLQQKNPPDKNQLEIDYEKGGGAGKKPNVQTITPSPQEMKVFNFLDKYMSDYWDNLETNTVDLEDVKEEGIDLLKDKFYDYYIEDPNSNQAYISDYGLEPLAKLVEKLRNLPEDQIGERITTLDKMLNVVHQRSDLASWFVKGGSNALADLSASPSEKAATKKED